MPFGERRNHTMIQFDLPKEQSSILKVIGIGGGGSNAVNHMYSQNIEGVNFIICNTDAQAISNSSVPNKVQLGPQLTQGLGAGANPQIGREATQESLEEIKRILEVNTKMAFITAGMGGGTGTGGAPIIAKICKDLGILTVGIVTTPFAYEGKKRIAQAEEGINKLKDHVDTLLVISNDKMRHQFGNLTMRAAFAKADNVLATAAKCITDVINSTGQINVDFADVCTVMRNGGVAILGNAECEGEDRAQKAIEQALNSPLLNDNDIRGAKWILININSAEGENEFTMDEVEIIQNYLLSKAGENSDVIMGLGYDNLLENKIGITLIATGFEHKEPFEKKLDVVAEKEEDKKIVMSLQTEEKKKVSKPLFLFNEKLQEETEVPPVEELVKQPSGMKTLKEDDVASSLQNDKKVEVDMMPSILNLVSEEPLKSPVEIKQEAETKADKNIYLELSGADQYSPSVDSESKSASSEVPDIQPNVNKSEHDEVNRTGGFLSKPSQIYAHELMSEKPKVIMPIIPPVEKMELKVEEPAQMKLVTKDEPAPRENIPAKNNVIAEEEKIIIDESQDLKRKAMERISKLRNLSFNVNATDPHNEFESVPAYLRRNMELHNSIANVESFYTNYTVKSDENNKAEIGTINSFLDGKKPD
ncbi:MAG: cell division protein FtsZ [Ginsengibacter sp.]